MTPRTAEVVVVGAGIAGISAAFHLAVRQGVDGVVIVEAGDPLSLTSDKSTECYRNWWPGPGDAMVSFMDRSIDLLERIEGESGGRLRLNRRGYLFATAEPSRIAMFRALGNEAQSLGAGELRVHDGRAPDGSYVRSPASGFEGVPRGVDLITDPDLVHAEFPYLDPAVVAVLHARRCGWLSAQQLGMWMLEQARARGARLVRGRVTGVDTRGGRVRSVSVERPDGRTELDTGGARALTGSASRRGRTDARNRAARLLRVPREGVVPRHRAGGAGRSASDGVGGPGRAALVRRRTGRSRGP